MPFDLHDPNTLYMLGGGFLTLVIIVFALLPEDGSKAMNRQLKRVVGGSDKKEILDETSPKVQLRRETRDSGIPVFDRFIKEILPDLKKLRHRLAAAGLRMTISEYLLLSAVSAFLFVIFFRLVAGSKPLIAIALGFAVGVWLVHAFVSGRIKKRCKNFIKFFPESIDAMVRGIRSGLPISESIKTVGEEMPDPIGMEFRAIRDGVRMGRSLEEAMWEVAGRVDVPEFRYLIIALSIQRETGGNLAETLSNVGEVLRRRRQLKLKIKAMSSEAKASAMILGALPFIMVVVLGVVSSEYIMVLFNDPRGNMLVGIALGIMSLGIYIMAQMINFEI